MGWSDVAFLTDGAANNALANREEKPRGANHLECSGESVKVRFKIFITSLQPMSDTIPSHCRVPRFAGNKEIIFEENAVPDPGPGELLLRVRANALCGSERSQFFDGAPVTPGHEAAGTVVAAGPDTHTPAGTTGAVFLMDFCGECRSCQLGYTNQCLHKRADMGFNRDGGYGQYELIHENIFFPVPDEFSATEATLLLDIMGTGGHAVERCRLMRSDIESLLILGAGPIGLGVLAMAKIIMGHQLRVLITDVVPYRLELAERLGGLPIDISQTSLSAGMVGSEYFRYNELSTNLQRLREHRAYLNQIITHRLGVGEIQR